jgi:hypothetical protein
VQATGVSDGGKREKADRAGWPDSDLFALGVFENHHWFIAVIERKRQGVWLIAKVSFERRIPDSWSDITASGSWGVWHE